MDDTEDRLRGLVAAARERPGQLVTGYGNADREALQRLADRHTRTAAEYARAAASPGAAEETQP